MGTTSKSKSIYIKGDTRIEGSDDIIKLEQKKDFLINVIKILGSFGLLKLFI